MPRDDITISRQWEPVPDHDVPTWEVGRYTAGPERVIITVENASATEDRRATVQAIEDLLLALIERERAEADRAREVEAAKPVHEAINNMLSQMGRSERVRPVGPHDCSRDGHCDCARFCCHCGLKF